MASLHVFLLVPQLVNDYAEIKNTCELLERKRILKKKKKENTEVVMVKLEQTNQPNKQKNQ